MTDDELQKALYYFRMRLIAQNIKPGTKAAKVEAAAFFAGAMCMTNLDPRLSICIMSGRDVLVELKKHMYFVVRKGKKFLKSHGYALGQYKFSWTDDILKAAHYDYMEVQSWANKTNGRKAFLYD